MKKILKIIMVVIMVLCIGFALSNFVSMEANAFEGLQGIDYDGKCMAIGHDCDIDLE